MAYQAYPVVDPKGGAPGVDTGSPPRNAAGRRGRRGPQPGGGQATPDGGTSSPGVEDAKSPGTVEGGDGQDVTNAVSLLQEYVQGCASFSPHAKILSWSFEQQLENDTSLQFRATVSFAFGDVGVPHHFCGGWQTSKKKSQRDTAERVRRYLVQRFERERDEDVALRAAIDPESIPSDVLYSLECVSASTVQVAEQGCIAWKLEERSQDQGFRATLTFNLGVVPHSFAGAWSESPDAARQDTAERVLWYFGKTSGVFFAENRPASHVAGSGGLPLQLTPLPPATLPGTATSSAVPSSEDQQAVENKTVLMQVQNALQKTFAKDTPPGERVWVWSYETGEQDPQLFRAYVEVPAWKQKFVGEWCRGKKLAQRNACLMVKQRLDHRMAAR